MIELNQKLKNEKFKELVGHWLPLNMDFSVTSISDSSRTTAEFIYVHFLNIKTSITGFLKATSDELALRSTPIMFFTVNVPSSSGGVLDN